MVATTPSIVSVDLALSGLMFPAGPSSGGGRTRPGFETAHRATRQHARCRRCGGRRRDLPQCRWAAAGPGRTTSRRAERSSQRGRLAGGPPPTGTHSGRLSGTRNSSDATRNANARQPAGPPRAHATSSHTRHSREASAQRSRAATTSATWTAFRAAPLRRLSPETTRTRPRLPSTAWS